MVDNLVQDWRKRTKVVLKKINKEKNKFIDYHNEIWGSPFNLLESFVRLCLEMGDDFGRRFDSDDQNNADVVFYVLQRLHVRGCQVSAEILNLLRGGFADGAHARWRTLHELAVIARFIANHDNEVAEKYLDHSAIVEYQRALQFRKHSEDLSYAPMSEDDFALIQSNYEAVKEKYKSEFKNADWFRNDYWWASSVLNKQHPNFFMIEENVGSSFMQPFVKLAHVNVHAGSAGVFLRLGSPPNDKDLLVAGSSIFGVGEPGQNTAYSIYSLTSTLLLHKNKNLDNLSVVKAMGKIMEEVMWEFDSVMEKQANTK